MCCFFNVFHSQVVSSLLHVPKQSHMLYISHILYLNLWPGRMTLGEREQGRNDTRRERDSVPNGIRCETPTSPSNQVYPKCLSNVCSLWLLSWLLFHITSVVGSHVAVDGVILTIRVQDSMSGLDIKPDMPVLEVHCMTLPSPYHMALLV